MPISRDFFGSGTVDWPEAQYGDIEFKTKIRHLLVAYSKDLSRVERSSGPVSLFLREGNAEERRRDHTTSLTSLAQRYQMEVTRLIMEHEARIAGVNDTSQEPAEIKRKVIEFIIDPCSLSCASTGERCDFKKENDRTTILAKVAFGGENVLGEWLDVFCDGLLEGFGGRKLCDAAYGLNRKFRDKFGTAAQLFIVDFANKRVKVDLDSTKFEITQKQSR